MAKNVVKKSLDEMDTEITCGVCREHYADPEQTPKVLPCCHYYCRKCISGLVSASGPSRPLLCPECRRKIVLPEGGVNELTTAYFVYRLKSIFETMQKARGKVEVWCDSCESGDKAEAFCRNCQLFICEGCVNAHKKMKKLFEGHIVTALADLKDGKPPIMADATPKGCELHEQPLCIYCFDCATLICQYCTVKLHRDHNFEFCKLAAANERKELDAKIEALQKCSTAVTDTLMAVETRLEEVEACGNFISDKIVQSFEELHSIIDARKEEMLTEADANIQEKLKKLSQQKKQLTFSRMVVRDAVAYAQRCLEHCTDNEMMEMHAKVMRQLEAEEEECGNLRGVTPVEDVDVGVDARVADALKELCQANTAIITYLIDPAKCTIAVKLPDSVEINMPTEAELILHAVLANGVASDNAECDVSCDLISLVDESVTKCTVVCNERRKYSLRFIPTIRGRHKLVVAVNGTEIGKSIPVFVSIHPKKLGKPVRPAWLGIPRPSGIAVNSSGDIVVMEFNGNILARCRDGTAGKGFSPIPPSQHQLTHPYAITVDNDDSIYCTDMSTNRVFKADKNGKTVKPGYTANKGAYGHFGIVVVGDRVILGSHKGGPGSFAILNKNMELLEEVDCGNEGVKSLYHMSSDNHGNVYAIDHNRAVVCKFNGENLALMSSFGYIINSALVGPVGVSVFGTYVYVANFKQHNIRVYTTEGVLVHSFGKLGSLDGEFKYPFGVCVDQDGFLYVSDMHNDRIQIF